VEILLKKFIYNKKCITFADEHLSKMFYIRISYLEQNNEDKMSHMTE